MRINTNLTAMNTYAQYTKNQGKISSAVAKLSSGYAINTAADNAAGLAISEKMRAQIRGLDKASSNAQDAISLVQTAEGALSSSTEILQRMREIAVQSSSDTNNNEIDRTALQDEFKQLQSELNDISSNTTFNKKNLLDGSLASTTKSLTNVDLGNSSLAISLGNSSSGAYNFSVNKKLETPAIASVDATGSAARGSKATAAFAAASVTSVPGGQDTALLNGNYQLSTNVNDDKTLTVTATGDNGQVFKANISSDKLTTLAGAAGPVDLQFASTDGVDDGFTLRLTTADKITNTTNGLQSLADSIDDTTVSISGGVDAKDATYGVYASLTGADSVKLNAGDTSVTFSNGVTVSFDALTATNLDTNASDSTETLAAADTAITWSPTMAAADKTIGWVSTTTATTFSVDVKGLFGGTYTAANDVAENTKYTLNLGGKDYTYTAAAGDKQSDVVDGLATLISGDLTIDPDADGALTDVTFTAAQNGTTGSQIDFTGDDTTAFGSATSVNSIAVSGKTTTPSSFSLDVASLFGGSYTSGAAVTEGVDYNVNIGGTTYSYTAKNGDTQDKVVDGLVSSIGSKISIEAGNGNTVTFTASQDVTTGSKINFKGNDTAYQSNGATTSAVATSGTAGSIYNYDSVFGDGTFKSSTSSFDVSSTANAGLTFQVGANEGDEMTINIGNMDSQHLGVNSARVDTQVAAKAAVSAVDGAINQVSAMRANLGAIQNRLTYKIDNLSTSSTNLTSAESQIRDVDMAKQMTEFTNANILSQAATAMLAQANSLPQGVLSLIGR